MLSKRKHDRRGYVIEQAWGAEFASTLDIDNLTATARSLNDRVKELVDAASDFKWITVAFLIITVLIVIGVFIGRKWIEERIKTHFEKELAEHTAYLKGINERLHDLRESLLHSAESVDTDLRERRHKTHSILWRLTDLLPAWPRERVEYRELMGLSERMREWYYGGGGIYLSNEAMAHYRMVQEALKTFDAATPHAVWEDDRNVNHAKADWQFTTADARIKLKHLYPSI